MGSKTINNSLGKFLLCMPIGGFRGQPSGPQPLPFLRNFVLFLKNSQKIY